MPLLTSPIDGSPMKQISRYGIEIDVCPTTGGIWLDRGELEKLMSLLKEEAINDHSGPYRHGFDDDRFRSDHDDDDDDDGSHEGRGRRRRGKMSRMMDIFDF